MDATERQARLIRLQAERFQALELGVGDPSPYMTRLQAAIEEARVDYITSVVTEIASLRRSLTSAAND